DSGSSCTPTVAGDLPNTDPLLGPLQHNPPAPSFLETRALLAGSPAIDAAAGCPPPDTDERGVARPQGAACDIGTVEIEVSGATTTTTSPTTTSTTTTTTVPGVTTTTATTTTTVPGATTTTTTATTTSTINVTTTTITATTTTITGSTTTTLAPATTAILAQTCFADVDPTLDDVAVQFHNPNGELPCATAPLEHWTRERHRGPFQFADPTWTLAQGLRKMQIKVQKNGSTRFTTAGKKMDLGRYAQPTFTTTVRVGDRCSTATIALRNRGNKKFVFP